MLIVTIRPINLDLATQFFHNSLLAKPVLLSLTNLLVFIHFIPLHETSVVFLVLFSASSFENNANSNNTSNKPRFSDSIFSQ
jgi:hypothetical protein